jgi:hypothetical protein
MSNNQLYHNIVHETSTGGSCQRAWSKQYIVGLSTYMAHGDDVILAEVGMLP